MKVDPDSLTGRESVVGSRADSAAKIDPRRITGAVKSLIKNRSELLAIVLILGVGLLIGLTTVADYGESWDEAEHFASADYAIRAYQYFFHPGDLPPFNTVLSAYGPAYYVAVRLMARAFQFLHPAWVDPVAEHFCYFLTFLACVVVLYLFLRRWFGVAASLGTSLLFASQPLFWGHAFMDPKDLPFMAFFLASVYLGFRMVDGYFSPRPNYVMVVCAAVMLGLTISFRIAGPWAGVLVGIYAISRSPRRSIGLLVLYGLLASIISYVSWPFLWGNPIRSVLYSAGTMSQFPFTRKVLFMGQYYLPNELPWFYYPVLVGVQFTLPAVLLAVAGLGIAVRRFVGRAENSRGFVLLFVGWFVAPLAGLMWLRSTVYDNGRQLFFLLPPIFVLVGLALDALSKLLHARRWMAGAVLLCLIPGVYGAVQLHPYEYTYYNQLVGGTGGAYGSFEMDYWGTSYREMALWLNQHAAPDSTLWAGGGTHLLKFYLRPDLIITCTNETDCGQHYDYVVLLARWKAEKECRAADTVFSIQRLGAILAVIKQLPPGERCK